ncbi:MAG: hypothetical protein GF334_01800, partial [Candidatus Altiarchaeales archaeon]|nr:hypothetical protein [Candidatus Altiarchaeales archaeon]
MRYMRCACQAENPKKQRRKTMRWEDVVSWILPVFLCTVFLGLTLYINGNVYLGLPKSQDEVVYLFQAETYSEGRLYQQSRSNAYEGYQYVFDDGLKRYGKYPPGWPLILALGVKLGHPEIINPLIGAMNLYLIYVLGRKLFGETIGQLAQLLAFASPVMAFISASYLSHPLCLFYVLVFLYSSLRTLETGLNRYAVYSAASGGLALITRPYTAAILIGLAFFSLWITGYVKSRNPGKTQLALFTLVMGFFILVYGAYNTHMTGGLKSTEQKYYEQNHPKRSNCNMLGFGEDRGCYPTYGTLGHNLGKGLKNIKTNLWLLSDTLFGWSITGFLFIPFILYERRWRKINLFLLSATAALILGYGLYWNDG